MGSIVQIPPIIWLAFRQAMLQGKKDNSEVIGFLFCERYLISKKKMRYIPKVWIVPDKDCYEYQSNQALVLKQDFHLYLLKTYVFQSDYHIIHIHTHEGQEIPEFSPIDDQYESQYAQFLTNYCPHKPRLISGVFNESLEKGKFKIWQRNGEDSEAIIYQKEWLPVNSSLKEEYENTETKLRFHRQQMFGQGFQHQLAQLNVTLIGCGGIGSIFAELLGRLGVKKWTLIDPDQLDITNLNRMPSATLKMAEQKWYKVHYVKGLLKKIYPTGSQVKALPMSIQDTSIIPEIKSSDLIVVATDNHYSRQLAQELAIAYMRPLVCLGTHIEVREENQPRMYTRITIPPLGGNWCLMCGNIINLQQASLEVAPSDIHELASQRGYLQDVETPSVFWLNGICASTAVGMIQEIITGFIDISQGLDWIYEFSTSNWLKTDVSYLNTPDCYFCGEKILPQENPLSSLMIGSDCS
ncbi:MAG: ThiF family adenylyltransferase [Crocosphaera sp.]|nr:ThiF family adenylyltransferase [Crocosphaera sp.]